MHRKFAKHRADLQNEMQIWKTSRRFAKRFADLQSALQICRGLPDDRSKKTVLIQ